MSLKSMLCQVWVFSTEEEDSTPLSLVPEFLVRMSSTISPRRQKILHSCRTQDSGNTGLLLSRYGGLQINQQTSSIFLSYDL